MTSWTPPPLPARLRSLAALAGYELRMTLRERTGRAVLVTAAALAFLDAALHAQSPLVAGVRASTFGGALVLVPLSLVLVAGSARRDEAVGAAEVVNSRALPADLLFLARFVGNYAAVLVAYLLLVAAVLLCPLILARQLASPLTWVHAFARGTVPLLFAAALGYCSVALARNVLAAALVGLYWLYILIWGDFLSRIFNFTLTQNWPFYAAAAGGVVLATSGIRRYQDRAFRGGALATVFPVAATLLLLGCIVGAWRRVATSHDPPLHRDPFALQLASQYVVSSPRVPGLWLPDQQGRWWRTADTKGKALVFAFWSPQVPASMSALETLRAVRAQTSSAAVAVFAVCLADDHALSPHLAREGHYPFPLVTDVGTHFKVKLENCSPLAEAYELSTLPVIYVTDRAHRLVAHYEPDGEFPAGPVVEAVRRALAAPTPPGVGVERNG